MPASPNGHRSTRRPRPLFLPRYPEINRWHFDLSVGSDLDEPEAHAVRLGAGRPPAGSTPARAARSRRSSVLHHDRHRANSPRRLPPGSFGRADRSRPQKPVPRCWVTQDRDFRMADEGGDYLKTVWPAAPALTAGATARSRHARVTPHRPPRAPRSETGAVTASTPVAEGSHIR